MHAPHLRSFIRFTVLLLCLSIWLLLCTPAVAQVALQSQVVFLGTGLNHPNDVAVDGIGNVYIADTSNNRVLIVAPGGGQSTVGTGLNGPNGVAVDGIGNVYIADTFNSRVVMIAPGGGQSTVGTGLSVPYGVAVDCAGNVYIADTDNSRVVKVTPGGVQSTVGTGLNLPYGVAVDGAGNVYIADTFHNRVLQVTPAGVQSTVVTGLSFPFGIAADVAGNVYIADTGNNRVVMVAPGGGQSTVGTGLNAPAGVVVDGAGNIYIADTGHNRVLEIVNTPFFANVNVGTTSGMQTLTYNFIGSETLTNIQVLTQGAIGLDFNAASGGTCTATTYNNGDSCTVNVAFTPAAPGLRMGAVVLSAASGPLATTYMYGTGVGPAVGFAPATKSTFSTSVQNITKVKVDAAGNIYLPDFLDNLVFRIAPNGSQSTIGTGLNEPFDVTVDGVGNVYIADRSNARVVKVTPGGVQTAIGSGFIQPSAITVDGAGTVYIIDDANESLNEVTAAGQQSLIAQNLSIPHGIAVDSAGNLYVALSGLGSVVKFAPNGTQTQIVITIISGPVIAGDVAVDAAGDVYISVPNRSQVVEVPVSRPQINFGINWNNPGALAIDGAGNFYVVDGGSVVKLNVSTPPTLAFGSVTYGSSSAPQTAVVSNIGNSGLNFSALAVQPSAYTQQSSGGTDCSASSTLASAAMCNIEVEFQPLAIGSIAGTATLTDNALNIFNAQQVITLTGTGTQSGSTTTMNAAPSPSTFGATVIMTATVSSTTIGTPIGTVTFKDGASTLGTGTLTNGVATFSISTLTLGSHSITAAYGGDTDFTGSTSVTFSLTVNQAASSTALTASPNPANLDATVTLTATVTTGSGIPTGSVSFLDGTTTLGTSSLNGSGVATFTTSALAIGAHSLTGIYAGSNLFLMSTSPAVVETIGSPDYTLTANPTSLTLRQGQTGTVTIIVTSINGFAGSINFACNIPIFNTTCSFSPNPLTLTSGGTATSTFTLVSMGPNTSSIQPMSNGSMMAMATLSGGALFSLMLAPFAWKDRKRSQRMAGWLGLVMVLTIVAVMPGCGGSYGGVYTSLGSTNLVVTAQASGAVGNAATAHLLNINVTITQ